MVRAVVAVVGCALLAACTADATGTAAPAGRTTAPAGSTSAPTGSTSAPTGSTSAPTGSTSAPTGGTSAPAGAGAVLRCAEQIGTDAPAAPMQTVLGVVALPASPRYGALQTFRSGDDGERRLFAKTGLIIRAGRSFDLLVPDGTTLGVGWGSGATPTRRLHVPACPGAGGAGWLAYPGGYWTDRPACVPLIVSADGRRQQVRIGLGTPCPGQRPPEQPTDR